MPGRHLVVLGAVVAVHVAALTTVLLVKLRTLFAMFLVHGFSGLVTLCFGLFLRLGLFLFRGALLALFLGLGLRFFLLCIEGRLPLKYEGTIAYISVQASAADLYAKLKAE